MPATGTPIHDPADLQVGEYYHIGYDIAIYCGVHEGLQWDGFPDLADEEDNVPGVWHLFEASEIRPESVGKAGPRFSAADIKGPGDGSEPAVKAIPATRKDIADLYQERRRKYQAWEASRPPERLL